MVHYDAMENLDKLTATGLPVWDLNSENLDRSDWSKTALGPRESWPATLKCLVSSCILPLPHCAAIFWGSELAIIHNLAWGKAQGNLDGQGARAHDVYEGEALTSLKTAVRGRTVKVGCNFFLKHTPEDEQQSTILLSTVLDENGKRQGVLAQLLHNPIVEKYLPLSGLDKLSRENPVHQTKRLGEQQTNEGDHEGQTDSHQTQLFSKFAELLPNGLAILDSSAEAIFVNDNFFKLTTNKSSNEFRAWPESIDPQDYDRVMTAYRKAFSSRQELRVEFRCVTGDAKADEDVEWRLFLLKPLKDDPEAGFIAAVVDITEIKQAQITQEKAAAEARERKEQQERFIDMVSHEIRNPLSAVLHLAEEVKEVAKGIKSLHSDVAEQIADIQDAADTILLCVSHQNTLVDDILSFSKLDSMMLSLVPRESRPKWDFSKALKVFHSEFKAKNIKFHYAMDVSYEDLGIDLVIADLNRMKQVLVNLITNAIKFTSKKNGDRNITVSIGASIKRPTSYPPNVIFFSQDEESFHIDSTMSGDWGGGEILYLMVAVRDTGIGINRHDQARLFERFRQATPKTQERYGGSGLGLFISRKLCQLHGGDIGVSSKDGEGSTFGFFFKVRRSEGVSEGRRPSFKLRNTSDDSVSPARASSRIALKRSEPSANSIKEEKGELQGEHLPDVSVEEQDKKSITSYEGVDTDNVEQSLKDPPTEHRDESHPRANADARYRETQVVSKGVKTKAPSEKEFSQLEAGETLRQERTAEAITRKQSKTKIESYRTLLLVEDNLINQKVLRRQLQARGFEVTVVSNGQEAIDAVEYRGKAAKEGTATADYFDCILMDQEMPVKDGNAATLEIRQLQEEGKAGRSPILGVSANVREAQKTSMFEAGMDDIISKPYKVDDLVAKIRTMLP
ncbi:putative histidine kinase HHK12p [Lojkania enalia]|uniref:Histidine kinase HHK12p n=1 Tax=Lojkania enalia TaxID=147567 RepID=A0A9P4JXS8_9PLEO|nr:putative histidine kinase HHK12p [Didymosphaeria enalia]